MTRSAGSPGSPPRPSWPELGHPAADLGAALLARCAFPPPGEPVTLAVSGGPDSLALLALAVAAGCAVEEAVHVDHGLRSGSAADAEVVRAAAAPLGVPVRVVAVTVPPGGNLEARARGARYAALPPGALTGHTADDQAETVLLHLLRGAGLDGLAGIPPARRPLLGLRRSETRALCTALGWDVVDDETNASPAHRRNRVRHEALPLLADVAGRDPVPLLARSAALARDDAALLEALAADLDPTDAKAVAAAPLALARRALRRWLADPYPPDAATLDRVLSVARGEVVACDLGAGRRVARTGQRLRIVRARTEGPGGVPRQGSGAGSASRVPPVTPQDTASPRPEVDVRAARTVPGGAAPGAPLPAGAEAVVGDVLVPAEAIARRTAELGEVIGRDYAGRDPLLVGVLKGGFVFMADLCRAIPLAVEIDFMAVSSYGAATKSSGVVRIVKDLDLDLRGRHVLLVEDIVDSGLTLSYLRRTLLAREPASVEVCALLARAEALRAGHVDIAYVGFEIPADWVVGYGLDTAERWRNLPDVRRWRGPSS